jgi:hypothetical protein
MESKTFPQEWSLARSPHVKTVVLPTGERVDQTVNAPLLASFPMGCYVGPAFVEMANTEVTVDENLTLTHSG